MPKETSEMGFDPTDPSDQFKRIEDLKEEDIEYEIPKRPPKFIRDWVEKL